jgi:tetratricopeptide (TPR) repeat protein
LLAFLLLAARLAPALAVQPSGAQAVVDAAYDHFYNLEFEQAIAGFERAVALAPKAPEMHNHLAEAIVFQEMFRDGALESEMVSGTDSFLRRPRLNPSAATEERFLGEVAAAMRLAEARVNGNPLDTEALYALGIAHGLRSNWYWVFRKSWRDSLRDATAARHLHNRVSELDPSNVDARLVQGLHDYIVGSLSFAFRMLGFLVGIRGDREKGIRTVQDVAAHGSRNRVEAEIFLAALYRRENQTRKAVPIVLSLIERFPRNFLLRLELSQMYSMAGDKDHALAAVRELAALKAQRVPGLDRVPWEKIWFQEGIVEFWYHDLGHALENMQRVTAAGEEVDLNTGVAARLRMGQIYDLTGRRSEALAAYRSAIRYAPSAVEAQESRKYLSAPYRRM